MPRDRDIRCCHTEHVIWRLGVGPINASEVRIFRAPTALNTGRPCEQSLREINWTDAKKGDLILALCLDPQDSAPAAVHVLQFWRVLDADDDVLEVEANILVGAGADGEYIYDRIAGLLGLPLGTQENHCE